MCNIECKFALIVFVLAIFIYVSFDTESILSDHHLRCGEWLIFELSKREKHSGYVVKIIYKKQKRISGFDIISFRFESMYLEITHTTLYQIWFYRSCYIFLKPKRDEGIRMFE